MKGLESLESNQKIYFRNRGNGDHGIIRGISRLR